MVGQLQKKVVFLTGTRAEFGKLKSLIAVLSDDDAFDVHIFVTGMHMLSKYGYTCSEIDKCNFKNVYKFINQNDADSLDSIIGKTISGLSDYVKEQKPDMIVIHGDRVEALAGAIVGAMANILVVHVEGGEISGTIDELIRHSVSKLSHLHFVANTKAKMRLLQLGEREESVFVIGSPDLDIMKGGHLPTMDAVRERYEIPFDGDYGILLYHSVTTEVDRLAENICSVIDAVTSSGKKFIVIYPNNDPGTDLIIREYERLEGNSNFRIYTSMRFEYFLTLMQNAYFMIGNSSSALMEAPYFGVPAIDIGSRQRNRANISTVINCLHDQDEILQLINSIDDVERLKMPIFGDGQSDQKFYDLLKSDEIWNTGIQKQFVDLVNTSSDD